MEDYIATVMDDTKNTISQDISDSILFSLRFFDLMCVKRVFKGQTTTKIEDFISLLKANNMSPMGVSNWENNTLKCKHLGIVLPVCRSILRNR